MNWLAKFAVVAVSLAKISNAKTHAKIDVHAHFLPEFYAKALQEAGHLPGPDGMPAIPVSLSP